MFDRDLKENKTSPCLKVSGVQRKGKVLGPWLKVHVQTAESRPRPGEVRLPERVRFPQQGQKQRLGAAEGGGPGVQPRGPARRGGARGGSCSSEPACPGS